jgi:hypothetical protein
MVRNVIQTNETDNQLGYFEEIQHSVLLPFDD